MNYETAMKYESLWLQGGVDAIEDFDTLRQVVEALYTDEANITLDWKSAKVEVTHKEIKNYRVVYNWI